MSGRNWFKEMEAEELRKRNKGRLKTFWAELPQVKGDVSEMMRGGLRSSGGAVRRSSKRRESSKSSRRWGKK